MREESREYRAKMGREASHLQPSEVSFLAPSAGGGRPEPLAAKLCGPMRGENPVQKVRGDAQTQRSGRGGRHTNAQSMRRRSARKLWRRGAAT
jgi:hypothetical protein